MTSAATATATAPQRTKDAAAGSRPLADHDDAWTFTLDCPTNAQLRLDDDGSRSTTPATTAPTRFQRVSLRATQACPAAGRKRFPLVPDNSNHNNKETEADTDTAERVSLLPSASTPPSSRHTSSAATAAPPHQAHQAHQPHQAHPGWTLASPDWTLRSDILLRVTFKPAWQALPAYTKAAAACCGGARRWCGSSHGSEDSSLDYATATWTTADVVAVTAVPLSLGAGMPDATRGLRVQLRAQPTAFDTDTLPPVPAHLQAAWATQVRHMEANPRSATTTTTGASAAGPVLYFCLPGSRGRSPASGPTTRASTTTDPPLLWRVHFPGVAQPLAMESITVLEGRLDTTPAPPVARSSTPPRHHHHTEATHIFINGFQSWSFAGSLVKGHAQPQSAMPNVLSRAFNAGGSVPPSATPVGTHAATAPPPPVHYTSDFFTCLTSDSAAASPRRFLRPRREAAFPFTRLDERGGPACILGWLSQREQFGVVTADRDLTHVALHASAHGQVVMPDATLTTDWAHAQLLAPHSYDEEPLVHFFHAVAAYNQARPLQNGNLLVGWCSWYHYYENISEGVLRENFAKLAGLKTKVPMNVSVVDDGYMTAWGDWDSLKPGKFTTMENVSRDIRSNEMRPGLWLAPFAADKHSNLARKHPDWIIQNDRGVAANSSNCGKFFYGLDATNPAVREHVFKSIQRAVVDWHFNVLKIDFLYAACLEGNGKYDLSMSRAQAMHLALDTIRQAAGPNTFLIGCGCPLATAVGYVDGMRVSADTGPTWYPALPLPWWDHGTLPCLRSMIRNSMSRAAMGHRWWHNDPDCLLLGESTRLTQEEVASAASVVAMTCGMMLLSDDLTKVTLSRMRILTKIFPMTGATAVVLDLHSTNDGLPSLLRLWATDRYSERLDTFRNESHLQAPEDSVSNLAHMEATFLARQASFQIDSDTPPPNERKRSCIHVCEGLGTWTIVSVSNWTDKAAVLHLPPPALLPPPPTVFEDNEADTFLEDADHIHQAACGYHAFGFWSSRYTWLPPQAGHESADDAADHPLLSRRLEPHETEIYHIKPVTPELPQYIGSDLHFSCGQELLSFVVRADQACVDLQLNPAYHRIGHVFLYLPRITTEHVRVTLNNNYNRVGSWTAVGNTPKVCTNGSPRLVGRVICIPVAVEADGSPHDGQIQVQY